MAQKIEVVPWSYLSSREVSKPKEQTPVDIKKVAKNCLFVSATLLAGATFALHGDFTAFASVPDAIPAMAQGGTGDFAAQLRIATKPIRDIITAFGHEIYGIFMLWAAIEMGIGKFQQGVSRMKSSTVAYIVLVWTPWIIETITKSAAQ